MAFDYNNYYELDWIESTGTQWIDSGIVGKSGLKAITEFEIVSFGNYDNHVLGSVAYGYSNRCYMVEFASNGAFGCAYINAASGSFTYTLNTKYSQVTDFSVGSQVVTINNSTIYTGANTSTFNNGNNLYIFGYNDGGTPEPRSNIKLYNLKLFDNATLVRDFIPARRKSDQVVGLYDTVNEQFYTNAGTGSFIGSYTPEELDRLDYIQSSGTQYINLKFIPTNNYGMETKVMWLNFNNYGSMGCASSGGYWGFASRITDGAKYLYWSAANWLGTTWTLNQIYTVKMNYLNDRQYNDGVSTSSLSTTSPTLNAYAFGLNNKGAFDEPMSARVWYIKITDGNNIIRHYVPAKRKSDNIVGMYELLTNEFYTNSGSGAFTYGSILTSHSISLATNPAKVGILSGAGTYYDGDDCTISYAEGDETYRFVNWSGSSTSTNNPYTFTVSGDASFTANLEKYGRCILL